VMSQSCHVMSHVECWCHVSFDVTVVTQFSWQICTCWRLVGI